MIINDYIDSIDRISSDSKKSSDKLYADNSIIIDYINDPKSKYELILNPVYIEVDKIDIGNLDYAIPLSNNTSDKYEFISWIKNSSNIDLILSGFIGLQNQFKDMSISEINGLINNQKNYLTHPVIGQKLFTTVYLKDISDSINSFRNRHYYPDIHDLDIDNWQYAIPLRSEVHKSLDIDTLNMITKAYNIVNIECSKCVPNEWAPSDDPSKPVNRVIIRNTTGDSIGLPKVVINGYLQADEYNLIGDSYWGLFISNSELVKDIESNISDTYGDQVRLINIDYPVNKSVDILNTSFDITIENNNTVVDIGLNKVNISTDINNDILKV